MIQNFRTGDFVAIVPAIDSSPESTLEIVKVDFANEFLVRLRDGRVYSLVALRGVTPNTPGFIQPLTPAHQQALSALTH
jgi:hypothetical protein